MRVGLTVALPTADNLAGVTIVSKTKCPETFEAFTAVLVDAFHRKDSEGIERLLGCINDFADDLTLGEEVLAGVLVPWEIVRSRRGNRKLTSKAITEIIETQPDADLYPGWRVGDFEDDEGREAYLAWLIYGYSFSGITIKPVGAFADASSALDAVRQHGIIGLEDYEEYLEQTRMTRTTKTSDR